MFDPSNFSSPKFNSYLHKNPFPIFNPSCGVSARISFLISSKLSTSSATLAPCPANNLGIWSAVDCKYNAELSRTLWKTRDPAWVNSQHFIRPSFSQQKQTTKLGEKKPMSSWSQSKSIKIKIDPIKISGTYYQPLSTIMLQDSAIHDGRRIRGCDSSSYLSASQACMVSKQRNSCGS